MPRKKPLVTIALLNYNEKPRLEKAFRALRQVKGNFRKEIMLCDNGSTDGSLELVRRKFPEVKIIEMGRNAGTPAWNEAYRQGKGDFLFFIPNDIILEKNSLNILLKKMDANPTYGLVHPIFMRYPEKEKIDVSTSWLSCSFYAGSTPYKIKQDTVHPFVGIGLISRKALDAVHYLFDEDYLIYAEDVDLGLRLALAGYEVAAIPSAIAYHLGSQSKLIIPAPKLTFLVERNLLTTFLKTMQLHNVIIYLPYVSLMRLIAIVKDLVKLNPARALARISAIASVISNIPHILKKRAEVQQMRRVPDRKIMHLFTEKYLFTVAGNILQQKDWQRGETE